MFPLKIDVNQAGAYYPVFYILAFVLATLLLIQDGRKRHYPMLPWLLVISTAFLFFILGTQVVRYGTREWNQIFNFRPLDDYTGRSVLGGLLSIPFLIAAMKFIRFRAHVLDSLALVFPLALAIQRVGCLLEGCCFGSPTSLPWGVQYGNASHAFYYQASHHLISGSMVAALPVHPVQVYDLLCCLLIVVVLISVRTRLRAQGNWILFSVMLYGAFRFFLEFFSAPTGTWQFLSLNTVQVTLLLFVPMLAKFIRHREKNAARLNRRSFKNLPVHDYLFYFLGLMIFLAFASRYMSRLEILTMGMVLVLTALILVWQCYHSFIHPAFRLAAPLLVVVALITMSQTYPEYSKKEHSRLSYNTLSVGGMIGNSELTYTAHGCNGNVAQENKYINEFSSQALGFSRTVQQDSVSSITFGMDGFMGKHKEEVTVNIPATPSVPATTQRTSQSFTTQAIRPFFQYNGKFIGFGLGVHVGEFSQLRSPGYETTVQKFQVFPSANIRAGKLDYVYFEYRLAHQMGAAFPSMVHQLSVGFGLGQRNKSQIRMGTSNNSAIFVAPMLPVGDHFIFEPLVGLGGALLNNIGDHRQDGIIGSFNLHYKFGRVEKATR